MTLAGLMFAGAALVLVTVRLAVAPMVAAMAVVAGMASWWNDGLFGLPPPVLSGFAVATLLALLVAWLMSAWSGEIPASAAYRGGRSPVPRQWHTLRVSALALFLIVAVSVGVKNLPVAVAPTAGGTVVLRISGDDEARVMVAADELHERLRALPGLSGVARTPVREQRWQLRLDDARMQESGVDIVSVGRAFDIARNGLVVGELNDADAQLPLRVQLAPGASGTAFERLLLRGERRDQHAIYLRDVGIAERVHSGREHIRWQRQPAAEIRARWRGAQVPPAIATLRASELPAGMVLQIEATTTAADVGGAR
jgi:hypothetical protein